MMVVSLLYWGGQRVWGYDIVPGCRQHTVYTVPAQYSTARLGTIPRASQPMAAIDSTTTNFGVIEGGCIIRVTFFEATDRHTGTGIIKSPLL